jgi:hypothetical protein
VGSSPAEGANFKGVIVSDAILQAIGTVNKNIARLKGERAEFNEAIKKINDEIVDQLETKRELQDLHNG